MGRGIERHKKMTFLSNFGVLEYYFGILMSYIAPTNKGKNQQSEKKSQRMTSKKTRNKPGSRRSRTITFLFCKALRLDCMRIYTHDHGESLTRWWKLQ